MFSKIKKGILIKNTLKNHFNEFLSRFPTSLIKNCSLISPCHSLECQALAIFYIQRRAERRVGYRDSSAHEITKVRSRFPTLSRVSRQIDTKAKLSIRSRFPTLSRVSRLRRQNSCIC